MRIAVASGLAGTASLIAGVVVPMMVPEIEPWIGYALLAAAGAMLLAALALWLSGRTFSDRPGNMQTTQGNNSPAIAGSIFNAPVSFVTPGTRSNHALQNRPRPPSDNRRPDFRLSKLIEHIAKVTDFQGENLTQSEYHQLVIELIEREIMDRISMDGLAVWGRQGHSALGRLHWLIPGSFTLALQEGAIYQRNPDAPYYVKAIRSGDLQFSSLDIERIWPDAR